MSQLVNLVMMGDGAAAIISWLPTIPAPALVFPITSSDRSVSAVGPASLSPTVAPIAPLSSEGRSTSSMTSLPCETADQNYSIVVPRPRVRSA